MTWIHVSQGGYIDITQGITRAISLFGKGIVMENATLN